MLRNNRTGVVVGAVLAFAVNTALADVPSDEPGPAPVDSAAAAPATEVPSGAPGHAKRPIVVGLIAAGFLLIAGLAGANDKPGGDPKKS